MKCPHCLVDFHDQRRIIAIGFDIEGEWAIEKYDCPNPKCKKAIFYLINGELVRDSYGKFDVKIDLDGIECINQKSLIRPRGINRPPVPQEVPEKIAQDYREACLIINDSLKASAALSRRCLQNLLIDAAKVKKGDLIAQIKQVVGSNQLPTYLADNIDAIRNIGNYAAHPTKSNSTGEIVEVEPEEAEWNLDVLEMLFDFYYVQPEKIKQKRAELNKKLNDAGKPSML